MTDPCESTPTELVSSGELESQQFHAIVGINGFKFDFIEYIDTVSELYDA